MTGLERDYLHQLTRIADALEKQNKFQEDTIASMNSAPSEELPIDDDDTESGTEDLSTLLKKLSKFK
jgi:uncharacterized coiled-coil protein SlyX